LSLKSKFKDPQISQIKQCGVAATKPNFHAKTQRLSAAEPQPKKNLTQRRQEKTGQKNLPKTERFLWDATAKNKQSSEDRF
jgi:hypothetical protein